MQHQQQPFSHASESIVLVIPAPLCADRWCSDSYSQKAKHTNIIFNMVRQIAYIHGRGSYYQRQRKDTINTWRRRITSTLLNSHLSHTSVAAAAIAALLPPLYSLHTLTFSHICSHKIMPLLQANMVSSSNIFVNMEGTISLVVGHCHKMAIS